MKLFVKEPYQCKIFGGTKIEGGLMLLSPHLHLLLMPKSIGRNFQFRNCMTIGNKKQR